MALFTFIIKTLSESGISNEDAFLASWIRKQNTAVLGFEACNAKKILCDKKEMEIQNVYSSFLIDSVSPSLWHCVGINIHLVYL